MSASRSIFLRSNDPIDIPGKKERRNSEPMMVRQSRKE
jgi:hypothetical protein